MTGETKPRALKPRPEIHVVVHRPPGAPTVEQLDGLADLMIDVLERVKRKRGGGA